MRIAVIADIHGNFDALQAVLQDCTREKVEKIFSLGDNIGYGPEPGKVIQTLIEQKVISILGNHEYALIDPGYMSRLNPSAQKSLEVNLALMSQRDKEYSSGLTPFLIQHDALLVHGCPPKSTTAYLFDPGPHLLAKVFGSFAEKIGFYGHTHVFELFEYDGTGGKRKDLVMGNYLLAPENRYLINPGSVGQPRDNINNKAKYLLWDLDKGTVSFKAVAYDIKATAAKIKALGLPDFNWQRLLLKFK